MFRKLKIFILFVNLVFALIILTNKSYADEKYVCSIWQASTFKIVDRVSDLSRCTDLYYENKDLKNYQLLSIYIDTVLSNQTYTNLKKELKNNEAKINSPAEKKKKGNSEIEKLNVSNQKLKFCTDSRGTKYTQSYSPYINTTVYECGGFTHPTHVEKYIKDLFEWNLYRKEKFGKSENEIFNLILAKLESEFDKNNLKKDIIYKVINNDKLLASKLQNDEKTLKRVKSSLNETKIYLGSDVILRESNKRILIRFYNNPDVLCYRVETQQVFNQSSYNGTCEYQMGTKLFSNGNGGYFYYGKKQTQFAKDNTELKPKKKVEVAKAEESKQEEFKPENKDVDNQAPIIEVAKNLKFESQTFKFKGRIKDKNKFYLTANGRPVKTDTKGRFEIEGFVIDPEQGEQLKLVAIDQWNNRSEQTVNIEVEFKQVVDARSYEKPNPNKVRVRNNDNKVGIIIGIEKYQTLNNVDAPYANRDANAFRAYANRALGIPNQNLKVLIDNKATRAELLKSLKIWLPQVTRGQQKDVYIFFAGHGLASDDGKDLHILPQDGDPILLEDTAISRVEMFELINKVNPNSVTMFFDTCYSGQTRSEQMLVAGLRPVRIVANEQEIPNNYTIFTASDNDETSGSIEQAEHGIFSYYLMKGLEGNADLNKDKTLTNGELIAYLKNNVSQEAFSQNRQQEPMLSGNPDNILIRY